MINDPYIGMPISMGGQCDAPQKPVPLPDTPNLPQTPSGGKPGDGFDAMYLGSLPLAMAYVPMQKWKTTYSAQEGLSRGTIFPELDLPFEGRTILSERNRTRRME